MASTTFSRSRSPVMSIRTQPEDEGMLRAEIEAAARTQHEILPRYSWHTALSRKEDHQSLRQTYRPVLSRTLAPSQLGTSLIYPDDVDDDQTSISYAASHALSRPPLSQSHNTKKSWKRLTKRDDHSKQVQLQPFTHTTLQIRTKADRRQKQSDWIEERNESSSVLADEDRVAQHMHFNAWLQERVEERTATDHVSQTSQRKSKRAIRRSVYGSLSATKSFFRKASKTRLEKGVVPASYEQPIAPHLYDFETKERFLEYLGGAPTNSPISPLEHKATLPGLDSTLKNGIAELSAGPLPAELEGTSPSNEEQMETTISRTSTPSNGGLPPYSDDEKTQLDITESSAEHPGLHQAESRDDHKETPSPYVCSSCQQGVTSQQIYDFCVMCEIGDRVLCIDCAKRGPCCQHEVEELLRNCMSSQHPQPELAYHHKSVKSKDISTTGDQRERSSVENREQRAPSQCVGRQARLSEAEPGMARASNLDEAQDPTRSMLHDLKNLQLEFQREMSSIRRDKELGHRERELDFRAREIDLRDQQTTLREREALVQYKSDQLLRNMESLLSFQQLTKNGFSSHRHQQEGLEAQDVGQIKHQKLFEPHRSRLNNSKPENIRGRSHTAIAESGTVAQIETVVDEPTSSKSHAHFGDNGHIKSYTAQKRKKDTASRSSSSSTPAAEGSPAHVNKTPSRGNSERSLDKDDDEEEEDDQRFPKKNKQDPISPAGPQVLFACPFSKNNPERFSSRNTIEKNYRGCDGHFLTDVSRLKQHLKRVHWQPETYCPRCFEKFENSTKLTEHAGATVACKRKVCPFPEKMDKTKQDKIHVKRPGVDPETVWYDIYAVLFPGEPRPDSPYVEREEKLLTPVSSPLRATQDVAAQQLSEIFNNRLNQHERFHGQASRVLIDQALRESFIELLQTFHLSPVHSPVAGPSIVVSPVSSSGFDRNTENRPSLAKPRPGPDQKKSETKTVQQSQPVPVLQHPRPPKLHLNTALQVPLDHHRSPSSHTRSDSSSSISPADVVFDIPILPHVQEDKGYDDDCHSFELGDDQTAMAFVQQPVQPSFRNKSVISIDSGYGSGRSHQRPEPDCGKPELYDQVTEQPIGGRFEPMPTKTSERYDLSYQATKPQNNYIVSSSNQSFYSNILQADSITPDFPSYSTYLDPNLQDFAMDGTGFLPAEPNNPWSYP